MKKLIHADQIALNYELGRLIRKVQAKVASKRRRKPQIKSQNNGSDHNCKGEK